MATVRQKVNRRIERAKSQFKWAYSDSDSDDEDIEWAGEPLNKDSFLRRVTSKEMSSFATSNTQGGGNDNDDDDVNNNDNDGGGAAAGVVQSSRRRATRGSGLSNIPYYQGFKKGSIVYNLGDVVLLRNEQYSSKFEHPHVAQIISLWQTETGKMEGNFRWFHQADDIEMLRRHQKRGNFPERLETGEMVYTLEDDKNEIDTVMAKCEVLSEQEWRARFGSGEAVLGKSEIHRVWFCKGLTGRTTGYRAIEWKGGPEMAKMKEADLRPNEVSSAKKSTPVRQIQRKLLKTPRKRALEEAEDEKEKASSEEESGQSDFESKESEASDAEEPEEHIVKKLAWTRGGPKAITVPKRKRVEPVKKTTVGRAKSFLLQAPTTQRNVSATVPETDYELARSRLHVKAVPDSLPCREDEFLEIQEYLESVIEEGTGSCIYISGVPGTGKTATVHEVIRSLQAKSEEGELSPFQFVEINGMKVTEPSYAYVLLWKALSDQKVTANHALRLLEKQFSTPGPRRLPCVVLMDELDLLVTSKQTVMYNFFEWPNWAHSRLIVVAVANTMDLPERMLSNKVSSRLGLTRINFQPYTYQQLVRIVESRLEGINAFRREAIEFAARKVGAVSGDARRALDICRRAVEIVETTALKSAGKGQEGRQDLEQVTIRIVDQAIKEMFASPNVRLVQTASLHQKLFLFALTTRLRRLGTAEAEFSDIAQAHLQFCRLHHIEPPMMSDLGAICASLGSSRALLIEAGKQDLHQRVRLCVSEEDVIMALKSDPLFSRLRDL